MMLINLDLIWEAKESGAVSRQKTEFRFKLLGPLHTRVSLCLYVLETVCILASDTNPQIGIIRIPPQASYLNSVILP